MRIPGKWGTNSGASGAVPKRTTLGTFIISEVPHLSQGNCACRGRSADCHGSRGLLCRHCFCVVVPVHVGRCSGASGARFRWKWGRCFSRLDCTPRMRHRVNGECSEEWIWPVSNAGEENGVRREKLPFPGIGRRNAEQAALSDAARIAELGE